MKRAVLLLVVWVGVARADDALKPLRADPATCAQLDTTAGALLEPVEPGPPISWTELEVRGQLFDDRTTVKALLEPTLHAYQNNLTPERWPDIAALTARFGYQLLGHVVAGDRLEISLEPLPMVRRVNVSVKQYNPFKTLLDEEVRRRMRVRTGSYLPWEPIRRQCALLEERLRIEDYLHDEGYFDASVQTSYSLSDHGAEVNLSVELGDEYRLGRLDIVPGPNQLAIPDADIKKKFTEKPVWERVWNDIVPSRFTRTQHQEGLQKVRELFQKRGYPAVRVQSSFDPKTSFDRHNHTVNITLQIDERRHLDVKFEGNDRGAVTDDQLRDQLTFAKDASTDDVEAATSGRAIAAYLQNRGYFDAHVTFVREARDLYDLITYYIDQGNTREVKSVDFVGNHALSSDQLAGAIATKAAKFSGALFGTNVAASSAQLAADVDRVVDAYRRAGYREARVRVTASNTPAGLDDPALTAALVEADRGGDLHVRFTIEEGQPTLLTRIELALPDPTLCGDLLHALSDLLHEPQLAVSTEPGKCVALASSLAFREDDVAAARDQLRGFLFKAGRPRAVVELATAETEPHRVVATFTARNVDKLRVGKVVVRGNFVTRTSIIYRELGLHEGDVLTQDALADAARRLRKTNLFNAVNIDLPELDGTSPVINAIVRVEERYDFLSEIDLEGGYSSVNGAFATVKWIQGNLFGIGALFSAQATYGQKIQDYEATLRFPQWLIGHYSPKEFQAEVTALYNVLDTPRFGLLTTEGASLGLSHSEQRLRTAMQAARVITYGLHYDFRVRSRNIDALRPIGTDFDNTQVAISTRTGSIGLTLDIEQRVDRQGNLAPLAPEAGYRLDLNASWASPVLFGQDRFFKLSATGTKLFAIGKNLVLRTDLRYDQGFPYGGAVLLPEVERFFAGGDNTVRGYDDDRMKTQIIRVGVPPLGTVSQIRVIPAGGDIRMLASVDAQVRIWWVLAGALFTDAGMITNEWNTVTSADIRPGVGMGLRALTPFGIAALEYAVPIHPELGDDPRGRIHFYFAARAQF